MQPIYKEFIDFLENQTHMNLNIEEGYYWLDNHAIKYFDNNSNLHILYRYSVNDDLSLKIKRVEKEILPMESWDDTLNKYNDRLVRIENQAKDFIKYTLEVELHQYEPYILTSTGKDSSVVLDLVHKVRPEIKVVFNNTSLDCANTYKIVKSHPDWIVTNPKEGFYQWINRAGFIPTKFSRACCSVFKEGNHIEYFTDKVKKGLWFMGIRNSESAGRADKEDYTFNPRWYDRDWCGALPIRTWSEFDVWLYILKYDLEINPKYKQGYTRAGCHIACPFTTKYIWILDKYFYPNMYERWIDILKKDFVKNERWYKMNCTKEEYLKCWNGGLFRTEPTDEVIKEFMQYKGIEEINIAKQFFDKKCNVCNKNVNATDLAAMNLKLLGEDTKSFYCQKHLCEKMNLNENDYMNYIQEFKNQGCVLF